MPNLVKRTDTLPSLSSQTPTPENQIDGVAGEAIEAGDLCYIGADGLFYKANSSTAAKSQARGAAATSARRAGIPLTIYRVAVFGYTDEKGANAAVPGKSYYVSATGGALSDTAPSGTGINANAVAFGRTDGNVHFVCA